jgi:hypothetical protein
MSDTTSDGIHHGSLSDLQTYLSEHVRSHDSFYDGNASFTIDKPSIGPAKEFAGSDVYYVNGVATAMPFHLRNANEYATIINHDVTLIHDGTAQDDPNQNAQRAPDLIKAVLEHESATFAYQKKPEQAVANAILSHVEVGRNGSLHVSRDMHFAAHSRGAIITQRGIELADLTLAANGVSHDAILRFNEHISVETFGGASYGMPKGVATVNYVDPHDGVAALLGVGPLSQHVVHDIAQAIGPELSPVTIALTAAALKLKTEEHTAQLDGRSSLHNGGYIEVPPQPGTDSRRPFNDLTNENHDATRYLENRHLSFDDALKIQKPVELLPLHLDDRLEQALSQSAALRTVLRADLLAGVAAGRDDLLAGAQRIGRDGVQTHFTPRDIATAFAYASLSDTAGLAQMLESTNPALVRDGMEIVASELHDAGKFRDNVLTELTKTAQSLGGAGAAQIAETLDAARSAPNALANEMRGLANALRTPNEEGSLATQLETVALEKGVEAANALRIAAEKVHRAIDAGLDWALSGGRSPDMSIHPDPVAMAAPTQELHVFQDGQSQTVTSGYHASGRLFDYGAMVGQRIDDGNGKSRVTLYAKKELFESVAPQAREALRTAIEHGVVVDISLDHASLTVHAQPAPTVSHHLERSRAPQKSSLGHEIGGP